MTLPHGDPVCWCWLTMALLSEGVLLPLPGGEAGAISWARDGSWYPCLSNLGRLPPSLLGQEARTTEKAVDTALLSPGLRCRGCPPGVRGFSLLWLGSQVVAGSAASGANGGPNSFPSLACQCAGRSCGWCRARLVPGPGGTGRGAAPSSCLPAPPPLICSEF